MGNHHQRRMAFSIIFIIYTTAFLLQNAFSTTYIVHMDPSAKPEHFSTLHDWFMATLSSVVLSGNDDDGASVSEKHLYSYTKAITGFSAVLSLSELEAITTSPGYVHSTIDRTVKLQTTHTYEFLGLDSGHGGAWDESGYGEDVIIGMVDTGIWPERESFSNDEGFSDVPKRWKGKCVKGTRFNPSIMCNKKLIGARSFNKGVLADNPKLRIPVKSARDMTGHGTHTSSTAAGGRVEGASYFGLANGTASGVAPRARVAVYKVFWNDYGAQWSDLVAAIDRALKDGVDVLSLSLGIRGIPLYDDPIAVATFAAIDQNVFVSAAAGNHGPSTVINGAPWVLTVAAGRVDRQFLATVTLDNGVSVTGLSLYPADWINNNSSIGSTTSVPLVFQGPCMPPPPHKNNTDNFSRDNIAVCLVKNSSAFDQQLEYINAKYQKGAILFVTNNVEALEIYGTPFPSVFLTLDQGAKILDYIKNVNFSSPPKATVGFQQATTRLGTKPAPTVASYSARDPFPSCPSILKPDLMAPGSNILASWPHEVPVLKPIPPGLPYRYNKFNIMSGTSTACPHAAGVAALLKGAHPKWSASAIRSAMMTTADTLDNTHGPIRNMGSINMAAATPLAMGSGHINPKRALDPGLIYNATSQDYVNLLCAMNFTREQMIAILHTSSYDCSTPSLDLNYPSFIAYFELNNDTKSQPRIGGRVKEFQRTLTNVGGDRKYVYRAKVAPMAGFNVSVVPDKLIFSHKYDEQRYKLRIKAPPRMDNDLVHGSLSWVEVKGGGKHVVTSPIVATTLIVHPI